MVLFNKKRNRMKDILEEVAEKYVPKSNKWTIKDIFQDGAKWQQERSYSEEEVIEILYKWSIYKINIELANIAEELSTIVPYDEWFEQFKKK